MLTLQNLHPGELSAADIAAWRALAAAEPAFGNPLLGPGFAQAVGEVRGDARVAVFHDAQGQAAGFLAYHRKAGGVVKPIGAPLCDYHALICGPDLGLKLDEALKLAGLGGLRAAGLVDPFDQAAGLVPERGLAIRLDRSPEDYLAALSANAPKRFKNWRRLERRLEDDRGAITLSAGAAVSQHDFDLMMTWKRDQLQRTSGYDFLRPQWASALMQRLFERREGDMQGLMIAIHAGGRLVAAHFGIRDGGVYHPWIASADPALDEYSPGQIFMSHAIKAMPSLGLDYYDLGYTHAHYKRYYELGDHGRAIKIGLVRSPSAAGALAAAGDRAWSLAGGETSFAARLRRRLDVIDSVETTLGGRVRGLAEAAMMQVRRRPAEEHA